MTPPLEAAGQITKAEILSQPHCWRDCLDLLYGEGVLGRVRAQVRADAQWVFVGCGSSYYIALAAAAAWQAITGKPARALPASELLLFPRIALAGPGPWQPVLISRSGNTSEVLRAGEFLERKLGITTLAITCAEDQPLEKICRTTLCLPPANEASTVMTRSFTSMLIGLQALAASLADDREFAAALQRLPERAQAALDRMVPLVEGLVRSREFADHAFLAQGPLYGIAREWHLKVKEMSCSCAQAYHSLEFRHGPKAAADEETLAGFLLSESGIQAESEVLEETKALGATTLVVAEKAGREVARHADLLLELNLDVAEHARPAAFAFAGQLLGLFTGLHKGLDPDHPRHLSRVVILNNAP